MSPDEGKEQEREEEREEDREEEREEEFEETRRGSPVVDRPSNTPTSSNTL